MNKIPDSKKSEILKFGYAIIISRREKMERKIEVEVKIDGKYKEPKVIIYTNELNENINNMINKLKSANEKNIIGYKDDEAYILNLKDIELIYTEDKKVYARTNEDIFIIKKRIFELEEALETANFVRISNSEIVNFKKVKSIDFKFTGTIMLKLVSGKNAFTSRRYIKKIKEYLGM